MKENHPLISVIIPVFNTVDYIKTSINSVLNQSYKNLQVIIVDDASTDGSRDTINELIKDYKNARLISLDENQGAGNARNVGLNLAEGELIGFVDSDDWLDSDFYSILAASLLKNGSDIAVAGIRNEYGNAILSKGRYVYQYDNTINSEFALELLSRRHANGCYLTPIVNNKLYRKELIRNHNLIFDKKSFFEDDIFTFWAFYYSKKISITSETNYHYFQRQSSITHTFQKKHIEDLFVGFDNLKKDLCNINAMPTQQDITHIYYAFFEKCFCSMLSMLFEKEQKVEEQKKYLLYAFEKLHQYFTPNEILDYLDINRIRAFFNI